MNVARVIGARMRRGCLWLACIGAYVAAIPAGCSSDGANAGGATEDAATEPPGDATTSTDATPGSPGSDAASTSEVSTESGADAAANDSGPSCLVPGADFFPAAALTVGGSCTQPAACGGAIDGTSWVVDSACISFAKLLPSVYKACSYIAVDSTTVDARGFLVFANGHATRHFAVSGTIHFHTTTSGCGYGNTGSVSCASLAARMGAGTSCSSSPPGCACTAPISLTLDAYDPASASGTSLSLGGASVPYCVQSGALTYTDDASGVSYHLTAHAPLPEICDGLDEDGNGSVDDSPVDCPVSCPTTTGVCTQGVTQVCNGKSGWGCHYAAATYEAKEATCDGLDNDCNGKPDDLPSCYETCDGVDDDHDGTIDDHLTPPTCSNVGACAGSGAAVCTGAGGWKCTYSSPSYEPDEQSCDGIDNDCDGQIDENCPTCAVGASPTLYYLDSSQGSGAVMREGYDGSGNAQVFATNASSSHGLAIDFAAKKAYWIDNTVTAANVLRRANLDGTQVEDLATWTSTFQGYVGNDIALDVAGRYVYWGDPSGGGTLRRMALAPYAKPEVILTGVYTAACFTLDPVGRKIYFCGTGSPNDVRRADLNGANPELVFAVSGKDVTSLAIVGGKLYSAWTNPTTGQGEVDLSELDGSARQPVAITAYGEYLRVDPVLGYVFAHGPLRAALGADAGAMAHVGATYDHAGLVLARCVSP